VLGRFKAEDYDSLSLGNILVLVETLSVGVRILRLWDFEIQVARENPGYF
jgi:hypothetical protein